MNKLKHFIQQSWLLIVASFAFGLLIAVTNAALSQRITQNEKDKLYTLMRDLVNDANNFEIAIKGLEIPAKKGKATKTDVYKTLDGNRKTVGFAYVAVGTGFADKIKLVIAVDADCEKFFGFKVLASNETPGFGSKIKEDDFANQFTGAPASILELAKTGNAEKIDSEIVAITGATVSSDAVVNIINNSITQIKNQMQKKETSNDGK